MVVGAQAAKQAVMQRLRDAEREILFEEFIDKEDILTGIIDRVDHRYVYEFRSYRSCFI